MPFQEDTDIDESALKSPTWGAFTLLGGSVEKLVPLNLAYAVQALPAVLAFVFPQLPLFLRLALAGYTVVGLGIGTGVLYAVVSQLCQDEPPSREILRASFRKLTLPALRTLVPLFTTFAICVVLLIASSFSQQIVLETFAVYVALLLLLSSLYWGPVFVEYPEKSALFIIRRSARLAWRYPQQSLLTGTLSLALFVVGCVSFAGFFLIVPVLIAVLQTRRYQDLAMREQRRQRRRAFGAYH